MEELGLAMLGGQLKYVSICTLHTDFEHMVYQLLRPAAVRPIDVIALRDVKYNLDVISFPSRDSEISI